MRHLSIAACAAVLSVAFLIPLASSLALRFTVASSVPPAPTSAAPRGIRAIDHMVLALAHIT